MRLWKTGIVCWKVLTQLRVECEAKRPMLHNENIRCHGNTCFTRLIILKYFVSNLCPHVHKRLNFEINRTTIENFLKKLFRKKKLNFLTSRHLKKRTSHGKSEATLPFGHPTRNILQQVSHLYDDLFKSYHP